MEIWIFKTSVETKDHMNRVEGILNAVEEIIDWNFDLDDCDNILRVVSSNTISARQVERLLNDAGITCRELED